jgi:hypothetical protein
VQRRRTAALQLRSPERTINPISPRYESCLDARVQCHTPFDYTTQAKRILLPETLKDHAHIAERHIRPTQRAHRPT